MESLGLSGRAFHGPTYGLRTAAFAPESPAQLPRSANSTQSDKLTSLIERVERLEKMNRELLEVIGARQNSSPALPASPPPKSGDGDAKLPASANDQIKELVND